MLFDSGCLRQPVILTALLSCSLLVCGQISKPGNLTPAVTSAKSSTDWQTYRDEEDRIVLRFPANWKRENPEQSRFTGGDGSVLISASTRYEAADECEAFANHKLAPLGAHPKIRRFTIAGRPACSGFPTTKEPSYPGSNEAIIAIQYPAPINSQGWFWWTLVLYGDPDHLLTIARSVEFTDTEGMRVPPPDFSKFMPPGVAISRTKDFDCEGDGIPEIALGYLTADTRNGNSADGHLKVLRFVKELGWAAVFEELIPGVAAGNLPYVDAVTSADGKQAVVVATSRLNARAFTSWFVLACVAGRVIKLDPMPDRMKALKAIGCESVLTNFVSTEGDLLVDLSDGSTERSLPSRYKEPVLELSFRFDGATLSLISVRGKCHP